MIERIDKLLHDLRLDWLAYEQEFSEVRFKLVKMREHLIEEVALREKQEAYLSQVEIHIENIEPHEKEIIVNGEPQPVQFITKFGN